MDSYINLLKGYISKYTSKTSDAESKIKEEEDIKEPEHSYKLSIVKTLNSSSNINIEEIESQILKDINNYKLELREIDYLYNLLSESKVEAADDETKMKLIGKIYMAPITYLEDFYGKYKYNVNKNILEAENSNFPTAKSKNCVFKGKWVYEILLLTNGLFQAGWVSIF